MKKKLKMISVLAAAMLISTVPTPSFGKVIVYDYEEDEDDEKYAKGDLDDDESYGPGYTEAVETIEVDEEAFEGPGVHKVSLGERYHEEYDTYEESIQDLFFFYANVGNGGLTHESVVIDIPSNITYTMEKDGLPYEYVSKTSIAAKGTYVLRLSAIENPDLPMSEQTEYQAVFRFRIQDEPPKTEEELASEAASLAEANKIKESLEASVPTISIPVPETEPASEASTEAPEGSSDISSESEETESNEAKPAAADTMASRVQEYNKITGAYHITFENGIELISSVPEGYVGPAPVQLSVSESDVSAVQLSCNDELAEFVNNTSYTEPGYYRMELAGQSYFFTIAQKVSSMDYYPVPADMEFTEVLLNGEPMEFLSEDMAVMPEDGIYTFLMSGTDGNRLEVVLEKDTTAPEFAVVQDGTQLNIDYQADDIAELHLLKDGQIVEGFNSRVITDPGSYVLTVVDEAGNEVTHEFTLNYQVNMWGILAVVLIIAVIAGIGVFFVHIRKNTKVR